MTARSPQSPWLAVIVLHFCWQVPAGAQPPAEPDSLIVWSSDAPVGQTWNKLGTTGRLQIEKRNEKLKADGGLIIHMGGAGWRGCGVNWKGWYPSDAGDDASIYSTLTFNIRQLSNVKSADLSVRLVDNVKRLPGEIASNSVRLVGDGMLEAIDSKWQRVSIPLGRFTRDKPLQLDRLWEIVFDNQGKDELTFQIDKIGFARDNIKVAGFTAAKPYTAEARILPGPPLYPIRDEIYGVCSLPIEKLRQYAIPVTRWGGNPSTRYNWKLNVDNGANDWFFKNRGNPISNLNQSGYLRHIKTNQRIGATTYQTVPMIGWVAKDNHSYSFPVSKFGVQKESEPNQPDVGNGIRPSGLAIAGNDPRGTSVPAPPAFIEEAVDFVAQRAGKPGVKYWALDNEPMLWHSTHRDVHPQPVGYDELWERSVAYAEAIKRADSTARVAGFCSWGWTDLFNSALDAGSDNYRARADFHAHDKVGLAEWFLKNCAAYKVSHQGNSLVDVFDVHWYPQCQANGQGPYQGKGKSRELNELRLRSTRDLWDPSYIQESWIRNTDPSPVALIRRVKKWIAANNPGMELGIGEYNFGGGDNISGGLAQAEVFGIFARERVDLAFIWSTPMGSQELAWKLFRNYDGNGGKFGDQYLQTEVAHPDVSAYAAKRTSDGAVTVAVLNKNLQWPCTLKLKVADVHGQVRVWRFDQESTDKVIEVRQPIEIVAGQLQITLPAASASMIVVQSAE